MPCSGHGVCKTLRDAGREFDSLRLVHAPVEYTNWEADRIQSCLCDFGYEGPDCSLRSCPKGRDPTSLSAAFDTEEIFVLQCQASAGNFALQFLGQVSQPIPFDADMAVLQLAFDSIFRSSPFHISTHVRIPRDPSNGLATVCRSDAITSTEIGFRSADVADWPPIRLLRETSSTFMWPNGAEWLSLSGSETVLRMSTQHTLRCPVCPGCAGKVYFMYTNHSISDGIDVTATGAADAIRNAVLGIPALSAGGWTALNVTVSMSLGANKICSATDVSIVTVELLSDFGNLPFLQLLDGSGNISFTTNAGNSSVFECSRQGSCDHSSGICSCTSSFVPSGLLAVADPVVRALTNAGGGFLYRTVSGDGRGGAGGRGDCGHLATPVRACVDAQGRNVCSGHGTCVNATCQCIEGWHGITCAIGDCPFGAAWFDEPVAAAVAHRPIECSGAGSCDRGQGLCNCAAGFSGDACELRDCPRASSGEACGGRGMCVSIRQFSESFNFSYGNRSDWTTTADSSIWDADRWFECSCASGFANWNCAARRCPYGHDGRPFRTQPSLEEQRVVCTLTQFNRSLGFHLLLPGIGFSSWIRSTATIEEVAVALEAIPGISNVAVHMPNAAYDGISTACSLAVNATHGGFVVRFLHRSGDLPLLRSSMLDKMSWRARTGADPAVYTTLDSVIPAEGVEVYSVRDGYSALDECSGPALGFCERNSGACICNGRQGSSDGSGGPGADGDCSWRRPEPGQDNKFQQFGLYKKYR